MLIGRDLNIYYGQVPASILVYNIDAKLASVLNRFGHKIAALKLMNKEFGTNVHTHNAVLLNHLPDDFAANNILYFDGQIAKRMSSSEQMMRKLVLMGPGEVACDSVEFGSGWCLTTISKDGIQKSLVICDMTIDMRSEYEDLTFYDVDGRKICPKVIGNKLSFEDAV